MLGFGLRAWNARTAHLHSDEAHYSIDAEWCTAPIDTGERARFLRNHTHDHPKLNALTGEIAQWRDEPKHVLNGHPTLHALLVGGLRCATSAHEPGSITVATVRLFNSTFDSLTIVLLPAFVAGIGGTAAAGLIAAYLYAVFPAAAAHGSLAYLDPLLAVLFLALLTVLARAERSVPRWLAVGALSALVISTKQTGLLSLIVVPVIGWFWCGARVRELFVWAAALAALATAIGSPADYLSGVLDPADAAADLGLNPLATLGAHLVYLADFSHHYWLGFAQHGRPLAPLLARAHYVVGPAFFALFVASALACVVRKNRGALLFCLLPVVPILTLLPPSNGLWRMQIAFPLVCATIALAVTTAGPKLRATFAAIAIVAMASAFVPLTPDGTTGAIPLHKLIFRNPEIEQSYQLFNPFRGRPFELVIPEGRTFESALWMPPGSYLVTADAEGDLSVLVDETAAPVGSGSFFGIDGYRHRLRLTSERGAKVRAVFIRPAR